MAKKRDAGMPVKAERYTLPSRFGSHAAMVKEDKGDGTVVCEDEFGEYATPKSRIDNGLSDPNRYAQSRIGKLLQGKGKSE